MAPDGRTCDIGADKTVDYMKLDHEDNPALGYRAIRICLTRRDFFKTQLRALLRASAYGNMSIMFQLQDAKAILEECKQELTAEGKKFSDNIEVGTMIETPPPSSSPMIWPPSATSSPSAPMT